MSFRVLVTQLQQLSAHGWACSVQASSYPPGFLQHFENIDFIPRYFGISL